MSSSSIPPSLSPFHSPPISPKMPSGPELGVETAFLTTLAALVLCWACWSEGGSHRLLVITVVFATAALACQIVIGARTRRLRQQHAVTQRDYPGYMKITRRWVLITLVWIAAAAGCTVCRLGIERNSMAVTLAMAMIALLAAAGNACRQVKKAADTVLADFAQAQR